MWTHSSPVSVRSPRGFNNTTTYPQPNSPSQDELFPVSISVPTPHQSAFEGNTFSEKKRRAGSLKQCPEPPTKSPVSNKKPKIGQRDEHVSVRSRITQDFAIQQKLGAGSYSTVHLLRRYNSNEYYALKEFGNKYKHGHIADRARARMEYQYGLSLGDHPHTVKYLQLYEDESNLFILMEYCARGNLEQFLKQHSLSPLKNDWAEQLIWRFIRDLLSGLEHIHQKNYVHLDLKPSNIFITERGTLKIGDYGVMRTADEIKNKMLNSDPSVSYNDIEEFKHMIEGDSRYLAPEFQQSPNALNSSGTHIRTTRSRARTSMIGPWSDIWALGLIVLELALDIIVPAGGTEQWSTLRAGIFPDTLEQSSLSPALRELIKWMMMPNPNDRPTATQVLQHYRSRVNDDSIAVDFDSFVKRDSRAQLTNSVGLRDSMEIEAWNSEISTHYQASFDRKAVKPKREVKLAASGAFMNDESSSEESELSAVTPVNPAPLLNPAMPIMPRKLSFADMDDD